MEKKYFDLNKRILYFVSIERTQTDPWKKKYFEAFCSKITSICNKKRVLNNAKKEQLASLYLHAVIHLFNLMNYIKKWKLSVRQWKTNISLVMSSTPLVLFIVCIFFITIHKIFHLSWILTIDASTQICAGYIMLTTWASTLSFTLGILTASLFTTAIGELKRSTRCWWKDTPYYLNVVICYFQPMIVWTQDDGMLFKTPGMHCCLVVCRHKVFYQGITCRTHVHLSFSAHQELVITCCIDTKRIGTSASIAPL